MLTTEQLDGVREATRDRRWHEVRLEDIAAAAGVSRMTLHRRGVGEARRARRARRRCSRTSTARRPARAHRARRPAASGSSWRCDAARRRRALPRPARRARRPPPQRDLPRAGRRRRADARALHRARCDGSSRTACATARCAPTTRLEAATLLFNAAGWTYRHMRIGPPLGAGARAQRLSSPAARRRPPVSGIDRRRLALLTVGHACADLCQGAVPALLPFLVAAPRPAPAAAAALLSAATIGSSIVQPLFGLLADRLSSAVLHAGRRRGRRRRARLGRAGRELPTRCSPRAFAVSGLGVAAFHPEAARIAGCVSGPDRARGMSHFSVGGNAGFALGPVFVAPLVALFGLGASPLLAVPGLVVAVLLAFELRGSPSRRRGPRTRRRRPAPVAALGRVLPPRRQPPSRAPSRSSRCRRSCRSTRSSTSGEPGRPRRRAARGDARRGRDGNADRRPARRPRRPAQRDGRGRWCRSRCC